MKEELQQEKIKVKKVEEERSQNKFMFEKIESELRETIENQKNELERAHKELKNKDYGTFKQRLNLKPEGFQKAMNELVIQSETTKEELLQEKIKVKEIENEQFQNKLMFETIERELRDTIENQRKKLERAHKELKTKGELFEHLALKYEDLQRAMNNLVTQFATTKEELLQEKVKVEKVENELSQNKLMFEKTESELHETIEHEKNELEKVHKELKNKGFKYQLELKEVNAELDKERRKLSELSQANQASLKMKDDKERKLCLEIETMKEQAPRKEKQFAQLLTEKSALSNKLKHNEIKHELFERLACKHEDLQMAMNDIVAASEKMKKKLANEIKELSEIKRDLEDKMGNLRNEFEEANKRLRNKDLENEDLKRTTKSLMVPSRKKVGDMECHTNEKLEDVKKELETNSRHRNKDLENENLKTKLEGLIVVLNKTRKELTDETKKLNERKGD